MVDQCSAGPDHGPNCLLRLSADNKSPQACKELKGLLKTCVNRASGKTKCMYFIMHVH